MKRITTIILLAMLTTLGIQAKHLSDSEALQLAFSKAGSKAIKAKSTQNYQLAYSTDTFYAFNSNNGFIILAADDCVPDLILGYSDNGSFDYSTMPDGMKELLSDMNEEIALMAANNQNPNHVSSSLDVLDPIETLVKSHWNQNSPYNLMGPVSASGEHYNAGCVPVAMSQVMYYHKWPKQGTGSNSYSWDKDGTQETISMDFSESVYDWDNILESYDKNSTEQMQNAVAKLLLDCGVSVNAEYRSGNTSANSENVIYALVDYFDYDKSLSYVRRAYYTKREWRDLLYNDLKAGLPVYYRGTSQDGGHAFVCDGYKDGLFHINWGWGGMSDGYFQIALLDPAEQGLGGSTSGYQFNQCALVGVLPNYGGAVTRLLYCTGDFKTSYKNIAKDASVNFTGNFENETCVETKVSFGIKMVDKDGNTQFVASSNLKNKTMKRGNKLMNMTIPMADATLDVGDYTITPAYYDEDKNEWTEMRVLKSASHQYVIATVGENDSIKFSTPSTEAVLQTNSLAPRTRVLAGYSIDFDFNVTCTMGEYLNNVYVAYLENGTDKVISKSEKNFIDLAEGEDYSYSCSVTSPSVSGDYNVVIIDERGNIISDRVTVNVEDAPTGDLAIKGKLTAKKKAVDDLQFNLNLSCSSGVFNFKISLYIYDAQNNLQLSILGNSRTFLVEGDDAIDILFSSSSNLKAGTRYFAHAYYPNPSWIEICSLAFKAEAATGIEDINAEQEEDAAPCYNAMGQRVGSNAKGIIIKNGKKYIRIHK